MAKKQMSTAEDVLFLRSKMAKKRLRNKEVALAIGVKINSFNTSMYKLSIPIDQYKKACEFCDKFQLQ
jgi:hypothetical protein